MNELRKKIKEVLKGFNSVNLSEIDSVRLMTRLDRKYIFRLEKLPLILESVKEDYHVLQIDGIRGQEYSTTYFDTRDMDLYMMHHRGRLNRQKIRLRKYNTDGASFLEIKRKSNLGITKKSRVPVEHSKGLVLNKEEEFVCGLMPYGVQELVTALHNEFVRITLVNLETKERVTLDYDIRLRKEGEKNWILLDQLCIAEIKRSGSFFLSDFARVLKRNKVYPMRFSKYCYGVARTYDNVPNNRFKEKFSRVDKLNAVKY